jgi:phenylpyruvate tautomerase PptA (4-oxalocrotonate tautomerase family)
VLGRHKARSVADAKISNTMPSTTVEVRRAYTPQQETAILEAVHAALVEAFCMPEHFKNLTLVVHPPHRFMARPDSGDESRATNISVYVLPGRSVQAKRKLYQGIVQRLQGLGIPPACVLIKLIEIAPENIAVRGGQAVCDVDLGYRLDV